MLNYYQREENLMNKTEIWLYSEVMKHLISGYDNRCQHQKVECRGNRPWLRPLTPPLPPQPFWMDKVCPPLLFVHPIGHLPARRTPRHGRPLPFFRDKDPPHPSHPPPLLPSSPGRREADILKEFIRFEMKRIWLKCRSRFVWRNDTCSLSDRHFKSLFHPREVWS